MMILPALHMMGASDHGRGDQRDSDQHEHAGTDGMICCQMPLFCGSGESRLSADRVMRFARGALWTHSCLNDDHFFWPQFFNAAGGR